MKTKLLHIILPLYSALFSVSTQQLYPHQGMAIVEDKSGAYLVPLMDMNAWSGMIEIYAKGNLFWKKDMVSPISKGHTKIEKTTNFNN